MEGTFPLACPLVQFPPRFACMVNESMPWHNQVKEGERRWDKKMAPNQLYLYSSLLYLVSHQLLMTSKPLIISISPLLIRDGGGCRRTISYDLLVVDVS